MPHNKDRTSTQHNRLCVSFAETSTSKNTFQGPTPGEAGHSSTLQHLLTDDKASESPQHQASPHVIEYQGPVYALDEDVEFLDPGLHSTPDASNQGTTEYFYIVDNTENPDAIQDTQTIISNFNNIDNLDDTEDSGMVQIGLRSDHYDRDLASTLPLMNSQSETDDGSFSEAPKEDLLQDMVSSSAENLGLPQSSTGGVENPKGTRYAHIWHAMILDDLLNVFMDKSVMDFELKMEFNDEMAVDNSGVSREVCTAFWEQFLELCEGEEERVPKLRPDFSEDRWHALGRIWAKGLIDHGIIPVMLSKAFIVASLLGLPSVEEEVLMSSFARYLSNSEQITIKKALDGVLEEDEEENLWICFHGWVLTAFHLRKISGQQSKLCVTE
ncbi:hypothetical protein ILYODFUR_034985 [Ilyodon furcidens]|uniref:Uncharacterized protein n=1 Tax=Ilyodon furcidens TaxID=33524 RepID=A0ABV0TQL7_9TELE